MDHKTYFNKLVHTADTNKRKGDRLWAEAKNGGDGEGYKYEKARKYYDREKRCRDKAEKIKEIMDKEKKGEKNE